MTTTARNKSPRVSKGDHNSKLREEFCAAYGLAPDQISFDGAEPIFDFDALNILANTLAHIPDLTVGLEKYREDIKLAESFCRLSLNGRVTRKLFGCAQIGEQMHDGKIISGVIQAINVSRARALRVGLRAVGFDPVKFHEARKAGKEISLMGSEEASDKAMVAQIHVHAGPRGLGFIKSNGDRTEYENLLASYFGGRTSSKDLDSDEKAQWLGMLRAWARKEKAA